MSKKTISRPAPAACLPFVRVTALLMALIGVPHARAASGSGVALVLDFDQVARLSRPSQLRYLALLRRGLARMDEDLRGKGESASGNGSERAPTAAAFRGGGFTRMSWLYDELVCPASAAEEASPPGFCINLGVVRAEGAGCDPRDPKRHDFDTREDLKFLGAAADCPKTPVYEKPCDPVFGFSAEDKVHCVRVNSTRTCENLSAHDDPAHGFVNVLLACAAGGGKGEAPVRPGSDRKVACSDLIRHFNENAKRLQRYCDSRGRACGMTRDRVQEILKEAAAAADREGDTDQGKTLKKRLREFLVTLDRIGDKTAPPKPDCTADVARGPAPLVPVFAEPLPAAVAPAPALPEWKRAFAAQVAAQRASIKAAPSPSTGEEGHGKNPGCADTLSLPSGGAIPSVEGWLTQLLDRAGTRPACGSLSVGSELLLTFSQNRLISTGLGMGTAVNTAAFDKRCIAILRSLLADPEFTRGKTVLQALESVIPVGPPGSRPSPLADPEGKSESPAQGWRAQDGTRIAFSTDGSWITLPDGKFDAIRVRRPDGRELPLIPLMDAQALTQTSAAPGASAGSPAPSDHLGALEDALQ